LEKLFELIKTLCSLPTVCGHEYMSAEKIRDISLEYAQGFFDSAEICATGSILLWHHTSLENAPTLLLDAHLDTIGFVVSEILNDGFVKFENVGGIDTSILPACEIEIYGKETVRAFFSSVPPHLSKMSNGNEVSKVSDTFADTGLTCEECERLIPVGTPAAFHPRTDRLMNDRISSVSLDDKICMAACLEMARMLSEEKIDVNVCVQFSTGEERGARGAYASANLVDADECIVLDVNFAKEMTSKPGAFLEMGKGAGLSLSACTWRVLTQQIYDIAIENKIPCQRIVELCDTGTNAQVLSRMGTGIKTAVLSIPIRYMHTSVETASLSDAHECAKLLSAYVKHTNKSGTSKPVYNYKEGENAR